MKYFLINVNKDSNEVRIIVDNNTYTFPFNELTMVQIEGCPNAISLVYKFEDVNREIMNYKVIEGKLDGELSK